MSSVNKKQTKLHIRKGDTVKVLTGNDRGKIAKVLEVLPSESKAFVEGVNIVKKHQKPSATNPSGGITEKEAPVHISNLMLVNPANGEATRTGRKLDENGKLRRYSKKTGDFI